ncbi:MAG: hypothetical protein ACOX5X_04850 [Acholeplasmataceae bacterium]|jgi:hypothetical protein
MNPKKAKRNAIVTLALLVILVVLGIFLMSTIIIPLVEFIVDNGDTYTEAQLEEFALGLVGGTTLVVLLTLFFGFLYIVFYILSLIEASKNPDNRIPFILLVLGLFAPFFLPLGLAALIGLILLLVESTKVVDDPDSDDFYYPKHE